VNFTIEQDLDDFKYQISFITDSRFTT